MVLAVTSLNSGKHLTPTKERKHGDYKGQTPNENDHTSNTSSGNDSLVTECLIYGCKKNEGKQDGKRIRKYLIG